MIHPLVAQLHFTRQEWSRGLEGVTPDDALQHFEPMNCISWMVGHFAWHEQKYWIEHAQNKTIFPELNQAYAYNAPMSSPDLLEMMDKWRLVTQTADAWLDGLTAQSMQADFLRRSKSVGQSVGSAMQRLIYHYWYHIGEMQSIRQLLGHQGLPEYVGDLELNAPYRAV